MRAVIQRVRRASVKVNGEAVGEIGRGLLVLLGVAKGDEESDAGYLADKISNLRVFEDSEGKMNLSLREVGGGALVVPQFTLYGDCRKGRRPSFTDAAEPEVGKKLYERLVEGLRQRGIAVEIGRFGAEMLVGIENEGPVTLIVESR